VERGGASKEAEGEGGAASLLASAVEVEEVVVEVRCSAEKRAIISTSKT